MNCLRHKQLTVDSDDYVACKRQHRTVRTATKGRLVAVTERQSLAEVSDQPEGSDRVDYVLQ